VFADIRQLIDTLLKVEALHAGATTPGERDAAEAAIERIKKKLEQFAETDEPKEMQCTFSNIWSKQLFCALAKRYDLQPFRYYRQRHTTVMIRVPEKFLNEVLWPEFKGLHKVLCKYIDEMTEKIISEAIYKGSAEEEMREERPRIGSEVKETQSTKDSQPPPATPKPATPKVNESVKPNIPAKPTAPPSPGSTSVQKAPRNSPCPCGSGKKYKRCCGKR
jgi:hypothetical protein